MDVNIAPPPAPAGIQGNPSKNPPPKRKRSSRAKKSREYVEDSELDEGAGAVPEGRMEEDELTIPVDEEQPRKKKKVNTPSIDDGDLPPVGSKMWNNLLICDRCRAKGSTRKECIVLAPGYSCQPCRKWKENCSQVPPGFNKLRRRRLTEREEMMWKVCGIEPSPSVPVKASGRAARKVSARGSGKEMDQSSPPSKIFGPRSRQLGLKKIQKTDQVGVGDLSVINEVG
jgi:hypothetical protein